MNATEIEKALKKAVLYSGSSHKLAIERNIPYSVINRYMNGKSNISNITFATLQKLFPEMNITFFNSDSGSDPITYKTDDDVSGAIIKLVTLLSPEDRIKVLTWIASNFSKEVNSKL